MKKRWPWWAAGVVVVAGCLVVAGFAQEGNEIPGLDPTVFVSPEGLEGTGEAVPEGAQPVLRGPVHEAFAQPSRVKPQPGPVVPKEPPKPIEEIPPDQKPAGDNVQWIPGYWFWDEEKQEFLWVSGIWRAIPPGMEWVPGTWIRVQGGWQWIPGYWKPVAQKELEVVPEPPEPPPLAEPPPAPGPDYFYVPGNWVYVDYRWYWRPGVWVLYRPGWIWTPACYYWTPYGYVFVDGFWDYPFRYRGWLFCPIWVDYAVCYRPGWFWRPCFWVPEPCLTSFLFVHTRRFTFFFGDFYDPFYARAGFISIHYYRVHHHCFDPVVSYYALAYRQHDPHWLARQRALTQARMAGTAPRPPRTLEEQRKLLAAAAGDPERQAKLRQLAIAGSVSRVNTKTVQVQKLDKKQLETVLKSTEETRRLQSQRAQLEHKLAQTKPEPGKAPLRIQPPAIKSTAAVTTIKTPPPPVKPKPELKPPIASTPSKPSEDKIKPPPSKPTEDKTKPPIGKPVEDKIKPSPGKPVEDKTKPPIGKPVEEKIKPPPSKPTEGKPKPIPGKPSGDTTQPKPTQPPIGDTPRVPPSKPPLEDRTKPAPSKPPEIRPPIRPPGENKSQPPASERPGRGSGTETVRSPQRPTNPPVIPTERPEVRPVRPSDGGRVPIPPVREPPRGVPPSSPPPSRPDIRNRPSRPSERSSPGGLQSALPTDGISPGAPDITTVSSRMQQDKAALRSTLVGVNRSSDSGPLSFSRREPVSVGIGERDFRSQIGVSTSARVVLPSQRLATPVRGSLPTRESIGTPVTLPRLARSR